MGQTLFSKAAAEPVAIPSSRQSLAAMAGLVPEEVQPGQNTRGCESRAEATSRPPGPESHILCPRLIHHPPSLASRVTAVEIILLLQTPIRRGHSPALGRRTSSRSLGMLLPPPTPHTDSRSINVLHHAPIVGLGGGGRSIGDGIRPGHAPACARHTAQGPRRTSTSRAEPYADPGACATPPVLAG